jgi:hypothetical protein
MPVETACALAVCRFNDGATSLYDISKHLDLEPSYLCIVVVCTVLVLLIFPIHNLVLVLQNLGDAVSTKEMLADDLDIPLDILHFCLTDRGSVILVFPVPDSILRKTWCSHNNC